MLTIDPPVKLDGLTASYEGNGRKFNYPTANISVSTKLDEGVYFGFANLGEYTNQEALIFVGIPTTVGSKIHRIEAHLLDITDKDYYGMPLQLTVNYFHRPNQHFDSVEELVNVMKADDVAAREWFSTIKRN